MENEKRMRREIANSNERRRMQSINAGFQSLRSLLPHHEGEKLSKVSAKQRINILYRIPDEYIMILLYKTKPTHRYVRIYKEKENHREKLFILTIQCK